MNETEVKFNCQSVVSTWLTIHIKEIDDETTFSLKINGKTIKCDKNNMAEKLFDLIKRGEKGSVEMCINGVKKEIFDIF